MFASAPNQYCTTKYVPLIYHELSEIRIVEGMAASELGNN
jgi:hypothetical protein